MFDTLLIANRGEIACRVIRTARRMGIRSVAVYSDADAGAMHVAIADEAHRLGPAPARESYLNAERILEVARAAGAPAIHPGYGFLAENADFAQACAAAGVDFVGPSPEAIRVMGAKDAAIRTVAAAGVPVLPGYHETDRSPQRLREAAGRVGYPLMIKPVAGGGGKGMRIVRSAGGLDDALGGARREAEAAFGNGDVLLERYVERPRHVEVQVFGDRHGDVVHLLERDCSAQRRHQKILEEAPAPGVDADLRADMGAAAVEAARAVGYVGAGTVEFLLDPGSGGFWFMEMNTRLQVEHAVTEMVTGLDLVEWQLRVAAGEPLPLAQDAIHARGHAIEARLYAEDPAAGFLPSTGTIAHLRLGLDHCSVRVDTGVREGDAIGTHYDPMIAKVIAYGSDRATALRLLRRALDACEIAGVSTNLGFLSRLAAHDGFTRGAIDTGLVERESESLAPAPTPGPDAVAIAALSVLDAQAREQTQRGDPHAPWSRLPGWRLNLPAAQRLAFDPEGGGEPLEVGIRHGGGETVIEIPDGPRLRARGVRIADVHVHALIDERSVAGTVVRRGPALHVFAPGERHTLLLRTLERSVPRADAGQGRLTAPMPGRVVSVLVAEGARVERGSALLVLEAMKMEHTITAPVAGTVERIDFTAGDSVAEGAELARLLPDEEADGAKA